MQPIRPFSTDQIKAARERTVFARFALAARPDIDPTTIESRDPPEPDIACSAFAGERLAFELAELCPPEVAKAVGDDLKRGDGVSFVRTADPSRDVLLKKLGKRYAGTEPVDLLCYADGYLVTPDEAALEELRATLDEKGLGPFRSVWFHGAEGAYRVG
jgi:hypothetical protein